MSNHLGEETSPYLRQHADNPVDWFPWGESALSRARAEDRPILLSIGYSACHWCHVMAHECFENDEIARLMNDNFINIKVDREERPDVDSIYMEAVQTMTGSGGWPLTAFLTPDGKPFFGGTYFPPEDRHGLPGFPRVLRAMAEAFHSRRGEIEQTSNQLVVAMSRQIDNGGVGEPLVMSILQQAYRRMNHSFDRTNGGFGTAPKFPQPMALEFLLRYFHRTQDISALEMVEVTLEKMAKGGIYDQIGGGFHRYATDASWLIPHFEKMLYDNALLARIYLHAYLATGKQLYRSIAEETLDYILREMTDPEGGFYSSQDADSEGVEGKYYLWMPQEVIQATGEEYAQIVSRYFDVTPGGNFDGQNILHVADEPQPEVSSMIDRAKSSLLKEREQRIKPGRDEKILASWNGLMMATMAEAACAFAREDYLAAAVANGSFLLRSMTTNGCLKHAFKDGKANIDAFLEDYALIIDGFLILHQATFRGEWLRQAIGLAEVMIEQFWDEPTGTLYDTGQRHQGLFLRPRGTFDGASPSGASAATVSLLKMATITGKEQFQQVASQCLRSMQQLMGRHPLAYSNWLCALDFYLSTPKEVVIIGERDHPATWELLHTLCTAWLPNKVVAAYDPDDRAPVSELKLLEDRHMINHQPTVYVCQRHTCHQPVTDPASLAVQLGGV